MKDNCPECNAPPGTCWSQSGSMGGRSSCFRDPTVGFSRDDWLVYVVEKDAEIKRLLEMNASLVSALSNCIGRLEVLGVTTEYPQDILDRCIKRR